MELNAFALALQKDYTYSIFDHADTAEELLNKLDISKIHILAHDMGDTVAQEFLVRSVVYFSKVPLCLEYLSS